MTGQLERGEQGTLHFQLVAWCSEPVRATAMHKAFPGAHVLKCRNPDAALKYVTKTASRVEGPWYMGTKPMRRNNSDDWEEVRDHAKNDRLDEIPAKIYVQNYPSLVKIRDAHLVTKNAQHGKVRGIWVWGAPGSGKSFFCRNYLGESVYPKAMNKWWDGYKGQSVVVLDDMDNDCLAHYMKIWTDVHSFTAEAKGSTVAPNFKVLAVTSNKSIEEVYTNCGAEYVEAIRRRFIVIKTYMPYDLPEVDGAPDFTKASFLAEFYVRPKKGDKTYGVRRQAFDSPAGLAAFLTEQFELETTVDPVSSQQGMALKIQRHMPTLFLSDKHKGVRETQAMHILSQKKNESFVNAMRENDTLSVDTHRDNASFQELIDNIHQVIDDIDNGTDDEF